MIKIDKLPSLSFFDIFKQLFIELFKNPNYARSKMECETINLLWLVDQLYWKIPISDIHSPDSDFSELTKQARDERAPCAIIATLLIWTDAMTITM